jgi:hypothetical protein
VDNIILVENGFVTDTGSLEQIRLRRPDMFKWSGDDKAKSDSDPVEDENSAGLQVAGPRDLKSVPPVQQNQIASGEKKAGFSRQKGNWSVYVYYGKKTGKLSLLVWALSTLIGGISNAYSSESILPQWNF